MVEPDWSTSAIMSLLGEFEIANDTLIILSSDHGPVYDDGGDDGTTAHTSSAEVDRGHDASGPSPGG